MTKEKYSQVISNLADLMMLNIDSDNDFDAESQKQILKRDEHYTDLLEHYVKTTKERNSSKEKYKWGYFIVIMCLLVLLNVAIATTIVVLLVKCDSAELISAVPVFITAIAGFASSIIAIPVTITKYLFSTDEDKYITDIISHTQEHDLSSRKILKAIVGAAKNEEKTA